MKTKDVTLYHRRTDGGVKVWMCRIEGNRVSQSWGVQDGKIQTTTHVVKGVGWKEEIERAQHRFERLVDQRKRKGYVERLDQVMGTVRVNKSDMSIFDQLPRNFAPAKPVKSVDLDEAWRWDQQGRLFIQRKRDGMRHYLVSDSKGRLRVYSSGKDDMTEHLQPLIGHLHPLPAKTIIDCELVVTKSNGQDGFLIVSGIARSLPERAQKMIRLAQEMGAQVQLMAFDLLWWDGEPTYKKRYELRYRELNQAIEVATDNLEEGHYTSLVRMPLVTISPTRLATLDEAIAMVKKRKWEGLVIWRKDESTMVRMNGSPDRRNCYKVKFVKEEDVVALGYELGKGKNAKCVGKFRIAKVNGKGFVLMGKCGTGLTDKIREEALGWTYPCVVQIEYDSKSEKGFRFPVFIRKRDDKKPSECA